MNTFISHSSKDTSQSVRIEKALEQDGHDVWLDRSEIRLGVLLPAELQSAISENQAVVLVWSKAAASLTLGRCRDHYCLPSETVHYSLRRGQYPSATIP